MTTHTDLMTPSEREEAKWDALMPWWREDEEAREARDLVSEDDVADADVAVVTGYGGDHRRLILGAHDE